MLEEWLAQNLENCNIQIMFAASDIEHLSIAERFQAMELIWGSLLRSPEKVPSPAWHGEVLSQRLAKVEAGQGKFLTLEQLKERLGMPLP